MKRPVLLSVVLVSAATLAPAAFAGPIIDRAATALAGDPVYLDPAAEQRVSQTDADRVRDRIAEADAGPVYVAVLPAGARNEAGGDATEVARELARAVRQEGTFAVVVGDQFRAGSTTREGTGRLADEVFAEHRDEGAAATLLAFVDGLAADEAGQSAGEDEGRGWLPVVVPLLAVGGLGFFLFRRTRRRREQDADLAEVKGAAQEDLLALADDIRALETAQVTPDATKDYEQALAKYEQADRAIDRARSPEDLAAVSEAVEEGRFALASAQARIEGREPPERRPPCFFDPRHGPSTREVGWSPPWGAPRSVPACEADAQRVEQGLEPAPREVTVDGRRTPYWNAPPAYGPWAGGFFGGFGGIFPAIMIGSMLGTFWAPPVAYGEPGAGDHGGGDDPGGGDFGDFGGGDFGGGDFGGGGFGGGDFGGG